MSEIKWPLPMSSDSNNEHYNDGFEDGQLEMLIKCKQSYEQAVKEGKVQDNE